jgi:hypothetical protein
MDLYIYKYICIFTGSYSEDIWVAGPWPWYINVYTCICIYTYTYIYTYTWIYIFINTYVYSQAAIVKISELQAHDPDMQKEALLKSLNDEVFLLAQGRQIFVPYIYIYIYNMCAYRSIYLYLYVLIYICIWKVSMMRFSCWHKVDIYLHIYLVMTYISIYKCVCISFYFYTGLHDYIYMY